MKNILFKTMLLTIISISSIKCQSDSSIVTASIINSTSELEVPRIIVVYGKTESKVIFLKKYPSLKDYASQEDWMFKKHEKVDPIYIENQKTINSFLIDMSKKGYNIQNSSQPNFIIFKKE